MPLDILSQMEPSKRSEWCLTPQQQHWLSFRLRSDMQFQSTLRGAQHLGIWGNTFPQNWKTFDNQVRGRTPWTPAAVKFVVEAMIQEHYSEQDDCHPDDAREFVLELYTSPVDLKGADRSNFTKEFSSGNKCANWRTYLRLLDNIFATEGQVGWATHIHEELPTWLWPSDMLREYLERYISAPAAPTIRFERRRGARILSAELPMSFRRNVLIGEFDLVNFVRRGPAPGVGTREAIHRALSSMRTAVARNKFSLTIFGTREVAPRCQPLARRERTYIGQKCFLDISAPGHIRLRDDRLKIPEIVWSQLVVPAVDEFEPVHRPGRAGALEYLDELESHVGSQLIDPQYFQGLDLRDIQFRRPRDPTLVALEEEWVKTAVPSLAALRRKRPRSPEEILGWTPFEFRKKDELSSGD